MTTETVNKPSFELKVEHPDAVRYTLEDLRRGWIRGVFVPVREDGSLIERSRILVYTDNCCPAFWQVDSGRPREFQEDWFREHGVVFQRVSEKITVVFQ